MKLYVTSNRHGDVTNIWVTEAPEDARDDDIQFTVECAAEAGDRQAKLAMSALPNWWHDLCERPRDGGSTRVYMDRAFCDCCY